MMKTKEDHQWYKDRGRYLFIIFLIMGLVFLEIGLADLVRTRKPVLLEKIQNPEWQCAESEEGTYYYTEVALTSGNYFEAEIGFSQIDPEGAGYEVELLDEYGTVYWIDSRIVSEETELSQVLMVDYSHVVNKADKASFFVYVPDAAKNVLSDINLSRYAYVGGTDPLTNAVRVCGAILLAGLIALTLYGGVLYHKNNKKKSMAISAGQMKSFFMTRVEYVVTAGVVLLVLLILYRNADIRTPLVHRYIAGDEKGYEYNTSCFVRGELNLVNTSAGGTYGAEQFDYPFSEWIQASLIAWIGSALDNPQMTNNLFYFLCYFLNAFSAVWLCRKLQYKKSSTVTIAVLFAFSPYIQMKYEHLWLNGYFIIPIAIYIALCIAGAVEQEKVSWIGVCGGGFLCAYTGLYYAFFSCALFAVALVIRLLRTRRLGKECLSLISCVAGVGMTLLPNLLYWNRSGQPASNPLDSRMLTDAETYSLRLVQMVMPREKHRIGILRDLTQKYESAFINEGSEWVRSLFINENVSSAIGLVAVCGFVLSILWLLMGVKEKRDHTLAAFNLSCILIASSGGLGVLLSFLVKTPVRAYNRMSIWIMLLSLLCFMSLSAT